MPHDIQFDVFLSHNSKDKPTVRAVKEELEKRGLRVWFDEDQLPPGHPWQPLLEEGIRLSASVAVLVGSDGIGPWEDQEIQGALRYAVAEKRPVIPVVLPDAPGEPKLPMFLGNRTWVDMRGGGLTQQAFDRLEWGVTGKKPSGVRSIATVAVVAAPAPVVVPSVVEAPQNSEPPAPWAARRGEDKHGLWADLKVAGVVQRMRWILPGTFWMGSPKDEHAREANEVRHRVKLTHGYWLADTPCTQALWEAVMVRDSPGKFVGARRPVENVSWDDCQGFLKKLTPPAMGSVWALPTEAQWEYACRGGTRTPYWFGETISPQQANYDGNYPYKDGEAKGRYLGRTSSVKFGWPYLGWKERLIGASILLLGGNSLSLSAPNPSGLYDMHGNVWEWCSDCFGDYSEDEVVDPLGPESGGDRVVRGGSWTSTACSCRSAFRGRNFSDLRDDRTGFRFAQVRVPEAK